MNCPKCKASNPDTVKFCGECGTPLPSVRGQESASPKSSGSSHPVGSPDSPAAAPESPAMPSETLRMPVQELTTGATFAGRYQIIEELGTAAWGRSTRSLMRKFRRKSR